MSALSPAKLSVRRSSSVAYVVVFILAVVLCEARAGFLSVGPIVLIPYVSVSVLAAFVGYLIGAWYLEGWIEALLAPVVVALVAVPLAGTAFALGSYWIGEGLTLREGFTLIDLIGASLLSGGYFIYFSWPVIAAGSVVASFSLFWRYSSERMRPNNAMERPRAGGF